MGQEDGRRRDRDLDDRQKDRHRDPDKGKGSRSEKDSERDASREKPRSRGDETRTGQNDGAVLSSRELEDRIRRSREERLKKEGRGSAPKLLAEQDDGDDLLGWVQKTKQLEEKKRRDEEKARAAATARRLAEAEAEDEDSDEDQYDARHLAGLKVTHGLEKVMDGGAIVLTLKDTSILDEKGNEVNDATDELENVEIIEQKRRDDARKAAKKGPTVYDKFDNDGEGGRGILPQYDDSKEQEEGVVLDEEGGLDLKSRQRMEEIQRKLTGAAAAEGGKESLLNGGQRVASEYFTQEEMERFKKPKEKKKKKLRKREKLDLDAMEEEAKAAGLGAADRGSRAARNPEDIEKERRKGEAAEREAAYEHALDKAEAASKALKDAAMGGQLEEGDEEDDELVQSLERARQAALKAAPKGVEAVASRAIELAKKEPAVKAEPDTDAGLVFTSTGEFVRGISLEEVVKKEKNELFDDDGDEEMKDAEKVEEEATGGWTEVTEQERGGEEEPEEKVESISEEVVVGSGVAGALKLLQQRGALSDSVDWGGRNMDKKKGRLVGVVDESLLGMEKQSKDNPGGKEDWPREVQLVRHDRFGRVMTPKEAWRELNHHFHGMYPSKNKKEKEYKQFMEEKKLKQMNPGDTPAGSVQKMRDVQAKTASPYIVLSGSVKPGQTSDFRSGFAVAEKETFKPGELTPMLADQKVQKFLGTKRKEGAGDMGPPPPKKPKT